MHEMRQVLLCRNCELGVHMLLSALALLPLDVCDFAFKTLDEVRGHLLDRVYQRGFLGLNIAPM